jgi:hypothetical protein
LAPTIAHHDDQVWTALPHQIAEALHDRGGLAVVRSRANFQVVVRLGHAQLLKEHLRQVVIVVLASVDQDRVQKAGRHHFPE